jgi:hypothetical protein
LLKVSLLDVRTCLKKVMLTANTYLQEHTLRCFK